MARSSLWGVVFHACKHKKTTNVLISYEIDSLAITITIIGKIDTEEVINIFIYIF